MSDTQKYIIYYKFSF